MLHIYPSILETTKSKVSKRLTQINGLLNEVQIDMCDGKFVPSKTFGATANMNSFVWLQEALQKNNIKTLELDLMVSLESALVRKKWCEIVTTCKPARTIFHLGSTTAWGELIASLTVRKKLVTKLGLGIHTHHTMKEVSDVLDNFPFSFVQVMGIDKVGYSGQPFSKKAITIIKSLKKKYPELYIVVDGAVNLKTIKQVKEAGADAVCPNSGLFGTEDVQETLKSMYLF